MHLIRFLIIVWAAGNLLFPPPVSGDDQAPDCGDGPGGTACRPDTASIMSLARQAGYPPFTMVSEQPSINDVRRESVSFVADGLEQYALLLTPPGESPAEGWPLLVFNHGFHPDPPAYGLRASTGKRDRPGDYYRGLPQAYAERGFLVVAPDFRGHADSEGETFSRSALATHWYVRDAIQAFHAARALPQVDAQRAFMAGHSMGAYITLRSALALGDSLSGISLWSTSGDDPVTYLYSIDMQNRERDERDLAGMPQSDRLRAELAELGITADRLTTFDQLGALTVPVQLHHGRGDTSTPFWNSLTVASRLRMADVPYRMISYDTADHLFTGADFDEAIERDVQWFKAQMDASRGSD